MDIRMKREQGQTVVEFTLVFIPFMIVLMSIFQIAHIGLTALLVNHAAFVVTRVGAVSDEKNVMIQAAQKALPFKDKQNISLEILSKGDDTELKIRITYNMKLIFPLVNSVIQKAYDLSGYQLPISATYMLPKETVPRGETEIHLD